MGRIVFDSREAAARKADGQQVILVRPQTRPEDLPGMLASVGLLTTSGGKTSHAAVVARGLGVPCVCGADQLDVDLDRKRLAAPDGTVLRDADFVSLDGSTGAVYAGRVPVVPSPLVKHFLDDDAERPILPAAGSEPPAVEPRDSQTVIGSVLRILGWADEQRRLGITVPGLYATQVRALAEAAAELKAEGCDPRPEIMVPLVGDARELRLVKREAEQVLAEVATAAGVELRCPIGTMIELPRAALTAGELAADAEFFSFGTNDLTQTTWGFSRDDVEGSFFPDYLEHAVFDVSPFQTIDRVVLTLVEVATAAGRAARPDLEAGVCGEHGGDAASIRSFHNAGLDYVSCSPYRVAIARLEAGRAALGNG